MESSVATHAGLCAREELSEDTVDQLEQSEGTDCERAAVELELTGSRAQEAEGVQRLGRGHLRIRGGVFLTEEPDGWKISAAGCRVNEDADDVPHECSVES